MRSVKISFFYFSFVMPVAFAWKRVMNGLPRKGAENTVWNGANHYTLSVVRFRYTDIVFFALEYQSPIRSRHCPVEMSNSTKKRRTRGEDRCARNRSVVVVRCVEIANNHNVVSGTRAPSFGETGFRRNYRFLSIKPR